MSYDLDVRSRPDDDDRIAFSEAHAAVAALPGVVGSGPAVFLLDRPDSGINLTSDLYDETEDEDLDQAPRQVSVAAFSIPYGFLENTYPVAVRMALEFGDKFDWVVRDLQSNQVVTKDSALKPMESAREVAAVILAKADAAGASVGELFQQEMWNHSLPAASLVFLFVSAIAVWVMVGWGWSEDRIGPYMALTVGVGGVALLYLKGLAQAYLRKLRSERRS